MDGPCDWDEIIDGSGVIPFPKGENRKLAGRRPDMLWPDVRRDEVLEMAVPLLSEKEGSSNAGEGGRLPLPLDFVRDIAGSMWVLVFGEWPIPSSRCWMIGDVEVDGPGTVGMKELSKGFEVIVVSPSFSSSSSSSSSKISCSSSTSSSELDHVSTFLTSARNSSISLVMASRSSSIVSKLSTCSHLSNTLGQDGSSASSWWYAT
jgi:hypothetical protein